MKKIIVNTLIGCGIFVAGCWCGEGIGAAEAFFMASGKEGADDIKTWMNKHIGDGIHGYVFGLSTNRYITNLTEEIKKYRENKEN